VHRVRQVVLRDFPAVQARLPVSRAVHPVRRVCIVVCVYQVLLRTSPDTVHGTSNCELVAVWCLIHFVACLCCIVLSASVVLRVLPVRALRMPVWHCAFRVVPVPGPVPVLRTARSAQPDMPSIRIIRIARHVVPARTPVPVLRSVFRVRAARIQPPDQPMNAPSAVVRPSPIIWHPQRVHIVIRANTRLMPPHHVAIVNVCLFVSLCHTPLSPLTSVVLTCIFVCLLRW
jgi:hypothetical protein